MNIDANKVIDKLTERIAYLTRENVLLVTQLEAMEEHLKAQEENKEAEVETNE
jgi:hypothetical protein